MWVGQFFYFFVVTIVNEVTIMIRHSKLCVKEVSHFEMTSPSVLR